MFKIIVSCDCIFILRCSEIGGLTGSSSGSTGNRKGLESSHRNIVSSRVRHSDFQESGFLLTTETGTGFLRVLVPGWSSSDYKLLSDVKLLA